MSEAEPNRAVLLYNDASELSKALNENQFSGAAAALQKYAGLLRDVLVELCGQREFAHIEFLEVASSYKDGDYSSPLAVAVGTPLKNEQGQLIGVSDTQHVLDIYGALTASNPLPDVLAEHVGLDDEGQLGYTDEKSQKLSEKYSKRLNLEDRFPDAITEEEEQALAQGLGAQLSPDAELSPLAPEELLTTLPVFLAEAAGLPRRGSGGPNLFNQGRQLVGKAVLIPRSLLSFVGRRSRMITQNVWRLEDLAVNTGKFALRLARKAARPLLVGYVLHRALTTIEASRTLENRMARLPPKQALDMYYRTMLGEDYEQQMEQDLLDAVKEVEEGLITEEYKEEKRLLTAAMLRRLEVEEWDKERMKHFYLGSYGLGPWYFDMEERLHNPYFIGARAWNGPVEGWVGKNKTYDNDLPLSANKAASAIHAIEKSLGRKLSHAQKARILNSEQPRASDILTGSGGLLDGVVDRNKVEQHLAAAT